MIEIGGKPILWHIMKYYSHYGFKDFVLALGYKGDMIKKYFYNYEFLNNDFTLELGSPEKTVIHHAHQETGWRVTLVDTGEKTLKGARLKHVERYIDSEEFLVTYGDGLADINLPQLIDFHRSHKKMATLTGINMASQFGELKINGNQVEEFREKPKDAPGFINGGFFVFHRNIFNYLNKDEQCDLEYGALEQLAKENQLMVYKHTGTWACMDTLRDMDHLNGLWKDRKAFWKVWPNGFGH